MVKPQNYKIEWTITAQEDLSTVIDFIARQYLPEAEAILEQLYQTANTLKTLPSRNHIVHELACYGIRSFREILFHPWRIIYQVSGNIVYIHAILDGRRNLADILLERFLN